MKKLVPFATLPVRGSKFAAGACARLLQIFTSVRLARGRVTACDIFVFTLLTPPLTIIY